MEKKQPERTDDRPLTLDFVLSEVVRILDEERASQETLDPRQLAA